MARVRQFAKDLGINYNQAKDLINKGRSRKDGGSQILENAMKPKKYNQGGSNKAPTPKKLRDALGEKAEKMGPKNYGKFLNENKELIRRDLRELYKEIQSEMNLNRPKAMRDPRGGGAVPRKKPNAKGAVRRMPSKTKRMAAGGSNSFPDLSGDGKTTMKDILIGRGVIEKPKKAKKGAMIKMRDGGAFRGCGAQVKGKKFKGVF